MARYRGRHRAPSTIDITGRALARTALAGAIVGAPILLTAPAANAASPDTWDKLAQCESGGNWGINTGNGFSGGLQFTPSTWRAFGGTGNAHQAGRAQQIAVAERVLASQGWNAWPACSKKLGIRGESASPGKAAPPKAASTPAKKPVVSAPEKDAKKDTESKAAAPKEGSAASAPARKEAPAAQPTSGDYVIRSGDSLSEIAESHQVAGGWKALVEKNPALAGNPSLIFPGQRVAF